MHRGFRHVLTVIAFVVALMSGILSLVREFLLFQYPTKFQEPPLFWASLRVACGVSLVALWYEERQKRLQLEKSSEPVISFKEEVLKLSESIMEFVYERVKEAPKLSVSPYIDYENPRSFIHEMTKSHQEQQNVKSYESDTLGIYQFKFQRRVQAAAKHLKELGLPDEKLDDLVRDPANWLVPYTETIKVIGKELATLAEQIADP